jgi:hypothetical protein
MKNTQKTLEQEVHPYTAPEIIAELELETRAGSPLNLPDLLDLPDQ